MVCRSMSPRFGRASPSAASASLSWCRGVPARTRTIPLGTSAADDPAQPVELDEDAVRDRHRREGVPAADRLDRQAALACLDDERGDLLRARRVRDRDRGRGGGARPVDPRAAAAYPKHCPSPRYVGTGVTVALVVGRHQVEGGRTARRSPRPWRDATRPGRRWRGAAAAGPVTGVWTSPTPSVPTRPSPAGRNGVGHPGGARRARRRRSRRRRACGRRAPVGGSPGARRPARAGA